MSIKILAISRFYKGAEFLRAGAATGAEMYLLTSSKLKGEDWPWEAITETYYIDEDTKGDWNQEHLINGLAYTFRAKKFDALVALDDFDVEIVSSLREYFRVPGMGDTTARYFRDKLAMRVKAKDEGIPNPEFCSLFYDDEVNEFLDRCSPPYMIKPRGQASATGIKKVHSKEETWEVINKLADERHKYLIEAFRQGTVYHVDTVIWNNKPVYMIASQYLATPFEVAHGGGVFRSMSLPAKDKVAKELVKLNTTLLHKFGLKYGASHSEFIKDEVTGEYYFLETSSRVGGANLAEMIEGASGINLWGEWAKIEIAQVAKKPYEIKKALTKSAGIVVSLSKYQHPDLSSFTDNEIYWRMKKDHHIGFVVTSDTEARTRQLLDEYALRIQTEFHASLPAPDRPTN